MKKKVYKRVCRYCNKEIIALSEGQAEYNVQAHEIACKKKRKGKKGKNGNKK